MTSFPSSEEVKFYFGISYLITLRRPESKRYKFFDSNSYHKASEPLNVNPRKAPKYDINILPCKLQTSSSKINAMRKNCLCVRCFNGFYHNSVIRKQCSAHKHANDP